MRIIDLYLLNLHHLIRVHHYALNHSTRMRGLHYQIGFVNLPWTISNRSKCPGRCLQRHFSRHFQLFFKSFPSKTQNQLGVSENLQPRWFFVRKTKWRPKKIPVKNNFSSLLLLRPKIVKVSLVDGLLGCS